MDDVSLKNRNNAADDDLDNLIFNEKKESTDAPKKPASPTPTGSNANAAEAMDTDSGDEEATQEKKSGIFERASIANVLPMEKLKNGASTATK